MRHLATSSLQIEDLLQSSLETVKTLKGVKLEKIDNCKVKEKGFLDKIWRKNLRIPDSPKSSLKRSLSSSSKMRARTDEKSRVEEKKKPSLSLFTFQYNDRFSKKIEAGFIMIWRIYLFFFPSV